MHRSVTTAALLAAAVLLSDPLHATTREIADLNTVPLSFNQSVISQLSRGLFRDPYDELLVRPYNLQFINVDRSGGLSPWPGQEGAQIRYLNALIGNNGTADVANGSDSLQGSMVRRHSSVFAWGVSAAYQSSEIGSGNNSPTTDFQDVEEISGFDLRYGMSYALSDRLVLGAGVSLFDRTDEVLSRSFEVGAGGFSGSQSAESSGVMIDGGVRRFLSEWASWEAQGTVGFGSSVTADVSETLDAGGVVTSLFVANQNDLSDLFVNLNGGYNRLMKRGTQELQVRAGYHMSRRSLDNQNLSFGQTGATVTPVLTLVNDDPVTVSEWFGEGGFVFRASTTQMFAGARLSLWGVDGSTIVDSAGALVTEAVDDEQTRLALTLGLRQPMWNEKMRLIVSGQADWVDQESRTISDGNSSSDSLTQTTMKYSVGLESVLGNVILDLAWLFGDDVTPSPSGARQTIEFDRLVVSALVAW